MPPTPDSSSPLAREDERPTHRARAAFVGLALGDAWGRPLEFKLIPDVRRMVVDTRAGVFHWTDDTQMAMYLARAVLDLPPGPLVEDLFGRAVGRRFAEWAEDPLTPRLAPGSTCLRGARAFARHGDWQRSGDRSSDGCGAVMRILPVALAFDGAELIDAARISAIVTHAHPNAVEASIAGAWLVRQAVVQGRFDEGLVTRAITHLRRDWAWGGAMAESLEAALELAEDEGDWLDEEALPPGDGGWRSASALGLAVVAALRWGERGFTTAVDKAARIEGDSDSVAAITGMLLGGARGPACLPEAWLAGLPQRDEIEELAARCWQRSATRQAHPAPTGAAAIEEPTVPTDGGGDHAPPAPDADQGGGDPATGPATRTTEAFQRSAAPSSAAAADHHRSAAPSSAAAAPDNRPPTTETFQRSDAPPPTTVSPFHCSDAPSPGRGAVQLSLTGSPLASPAPAAPPTIESGRPRTSLDHPQHVRWLDLAITGPRAPRGRIGLSPAPGRVDGATWRRHLGVDLDRLVALYRVDHMLLLLDPVEQAALGIAALESEAEARGIVVHPLPLAPGAAPSVGRADEVCSLLLAVARAGRRIAIVGREGEERPGTIAAAVFLALGVKPELALRAARAAAGPRAASSQDQRSFLAAFASRAGS